MSTVAPRVVTVGPHEFRFVPPDQLHFFFRGEFNGAQVDQYLDFVFAHGDQCNGPLYSVYHLNAFTRATESARKRVVNVGRKYPYAALAAVGANFATRVVAGMILTAGRLIAPQHFTFPVGFFPNVDEANAWFDELRRKAV